MEIISRYNNPDIAIISIGNALAFDHKHLDEETVGEEIFGIAHAYGAVPENGHVFWALPPIRDFGHTFRGVYEIPQIEGSCSRIYKTKNRTDGIIFYPHATPLTIAVTSRDCPYLILSLKDTFGEKVVLILHCGRDQLHNVLGGNPRESVIANALSWFPGFDPKEVCGFVTLGIAPEHFENNFYTTIVEGVRECWGDAVIPDTTRCTIDLKEIIYRQLECFKINRTQVVDDGVDTFTDTRCASVRAKRGQTHNLILVTCT